MIIPEILEYLNDADLEDWLTAAFIENESQLPLDVLCTNGGFRSASRIPDIWMVELTDRTGKLWNGRFNVEFSEERKNGPETEPRIERQTGLLRFTPDAKLGVLDCRRGIGLDVSHASHAAGLLLRRRRQRHDFRIGIGQSH